MKFYLLVLSLFIFQGVFTKDVAQISWEATPGSDTGVLHYLIDADYTEQKKYLDAILEALETDNDGDIISRKIGLNTTESVLGYAAWEGKIGAGVQTFVEVETKGQGMNKHVIAINEKLLNQYSAILGYLLRQDAVIWYIQDHNISLSESENGVEALFNLNINEKEFQIAYNTIFAVFGTWDLAPGFTKEGFTVINFEENIENATFREGMVKVFSHLKKIGIGNGLKNQKKFRSIGEYISNDWTKFPDGKNYFQIVNDKELWDWAIEIRKSRIDIVNEEYERNTIKSFLRKF